MFWVSNSWKDTWWSRNKINCWKGLAQRDCSLDNAVRHTPTPSSWASCRWKTHTLCHMLKRKAARTTVFLWLCVSWCGEGIDIYRYPRTRFSLSRHVRHSKAWYRGGLAFLGFTCLVQGGLWMWISRAMFYRKCYLMFPFFSNREGYGPNGTFRSWSRGNRCREMGNVTLVYA